MPCPYDSRKPKNRAGQAPPLQIPPRSTLRKSYLRRLLPSLSSSMEDGSWNSYSIRLCSSSSQAMRVALSVLGFSMSDGAPAMIWRARRAASTTYANWLSGAFVATVISVFPPKRCQKFFHPWSAPRSGTANRHHNGLCFVSRAFHVFVHDAIIVITSESCNLVPRLRQTPRNFFVGVLAPAAQATFKFHTRRRQNKNRHRFRQLFLYLRGA